MQLYKRLRREYEQGLGTIRGVAQNTMCIGALFGRPSRTQCRQSEKLRLEGGLKWRWPYRSLKLS